MANNMKNQIVRSCLVALIVLTLLLGCIPTTVIAKIALPDTHSLDTLNLPADDIIMGTVPGNFNSTTSNLYTYIEKANPATATGKITRVASRAHTTLQGVKFGTFYVTSGTNLKCRDMVEVGTVGTDQTYYFDVDLDVVAGDYIGISWTSGALERNTSGGSGYFYAAGDHVIIGDEATYTEFTSAYKHAIYGTGIRIIAGAPTVTTSATTSIGYWSGTLNGEITSIGDSDVIARGFEWDTDPGVPYANEWHEEGVFGTGTFNYPKTNWTDGVTYYYRAYATNTEGTAYGTEMTFSTPLLTDVYWVNNGGAFDSTEHWSLTSGGAVEPRAVPNANRNAHFDANSFTLPDQTVYVGDFKFPNCKDFDWTGVTNTPTFRISGTWNGADLGVYGNLILSPNMVFAESGSYDSGDFYGIKMKGTSGPYTIDTKGINIGCSLTLTGGQTYTLIGDLNLINSSTYNKFTTGNATVDFNNYNVTVGTFTHTSSTAPAELLNIGTLTIYNASTFYVGAYESFGTVNLTGTGNYVVTAYTNSEIANLNHTPPYGTANSLTITNDNLTVTNTLTITGSNAGDGRTLIGSNVWGTARTITAANVAITNTNFRNITGAGASDWDVSAGLCGDVGGNNNIIFTTPATLYWVGDFGNFSDVTHWASSSGGVGGSGRVPLAQDTAVFDANSIPEPSRTITLDIQELPAIYAADITNNPTFYRNSTAFVHGNFTMGTALWDVNDTYMYGDTDTTIISTSVLDTNLVIRKKPTATVYAGNDFILRGAIRLYSGILDFAGKNVTATLFDNNTLGTTYVRSVILGSGTLTLNGTAAGSKWDISTTNFTFSGASSTIRLTNSTTSAQTFEGNNYIYGNLTIEGAGAYQTTIQGNNQFTDFTIDRSQAAKTVVFTAGTTQTISHFYVPLSGTTTTTIKSSSTTNATISKSAGIVWSDYLTITDLTGTGGASFYAGSNSTITDSPGWNEGEPSFPTTTSDVTTEITDISATLNGTLTSLGDFDLAYVFFQWGQDETMETYDTTTQEMFTEVGTFDAPLAGLSSMQTYYYRAVVRYNVSSYAYGEISSFTTVPASLTTALWFQPVAMLNGSTILDRGISDGAQNGTITWGTLAAGLSTSWNVGELTTITLAATNTQDNNATLNGMLSSLGSYAAADVYFQYGLNTSYGSTTSFQNRTSTGVFYADITNLQPSTTYHFRAVAVGTDIVVYGPDMTFTTTGAGVPGTNLPDILTIVDAKVVSGYMTAGDQLYLVSYKCIYLDGTPNAPASDYFVIQILNNGQVVGQWALPGWGYQPVGLYLGPNSALPYGGTYTIRIMGIEKMWPTPPIPSAVRQLNPSDWLGTNLTQLDNWVITTAQSIGSYYDTELVTYTATGTVLNSAGGALFNQNISGLSNIRPMLFSAYATRPSPTSTPSTGTSYIDTWNASTNLGPYINELLEDGATTMEMDQIAFNNFVGICLWLIIVVILLFAFRGSFMAALIGAPVLVGISFAGLLVPVAIVILAVLNVALLAYALLPRGTG